MRVLLVDGDLDYIKSYMAEIEKDYVVDVAYTASDGAYLSEVNDYDVIVIDSALPDRDGRLLCKEVRDANIGSPILYLSEKEEPATRVQCLRDGANVCLSKHVSPAELSAQIRALLLLRHRYASQNLTKVGLLEIDFEKQEVRFGNSQINLRKKEYSILEYLLLNRGRIVSKEELLDHIWEEGILVQSNLLEVHIRNLRTKIEKSPNTRTIQTFRGFGYKIA